MKKILKNREIVGNTTYWAEVDQKEIYKTFIMYKTVRGEKEHVEWKKISFKNYARPRTTFVFWIKLMGRLPNKGMLVRFGIITDRKCSFCDQE